MTCLETDIETTTAPRLRVVRLPAVETEGPFDEVYATAPATLLDPPLSGALALALPLSAEPARQPVPPAPVPPEPAPLRLVPDDADDFSARRTPRAELPAPGPRATVLVRALLEVIAGDRSLQQLMPWVSQEVYQQVEELVCPRSARPWATSLQRVVVAEPASGVAEVAAVVRRGSRCGAIALRLEGIDGRWLMTQLQLG